MEINPKAHAPTPLQPGSLEFISELLPSHLECNCFWNYWNLKFPIPFLIPRRFITFEILMNFSLLIQICITSTLVVVGILPSYKSHSLCRDWPEHAHSIRIEIIKKVVFANQ